MDEADVALFLIDAKAGLTPDDEFADILRKSGKPVVLVANKAEARALNPVCMRPSGSAWANPVGFPPSTAAACRSA
jgi:GTP-binding protein